MFIERFSKPRALVLKITRKVDQVIIPEIPHKQFKKDIFYIVSVFNVFNWVLLERWLLDRSQEVITHIVYELPSNRET